MAHNHFLAFGNSDQESFRNLEVQNSFDVMTVPGTIASYYSEATAAFVLSSQLDYAIDPRTPLFQDDVADPRASHLSLATWHGPAVRGALDAGVVNLPAHFYTPDVIREMVTSIVGRQRHYDENAATVQKKIDRYAALLAEALASQGAAAPERDTRPPKFVLAPYFAVGADGDPWRSVQQEIWAASERLESPELVSPVVCVDGRQSARQAGSNLLSTILSRIPESLSKNVFFWITDFDERSVGAQALREFWGAVGDHRDQFSLVNMYGSYFSICAQHAGLAGFGNGLTYSESRSWPALASTGAAPPRYYIEKLHGFLPVAQAAALVDADSYFRCDCSACDDWRTGGRSIASLPFHDLKRHFAIARSQELSFAADSSLIEIAEQADEAAARFVAVRDRAELSGTRGFAYLNEWSAVFREFA